MAQRPNWIGALSWNFWYELHRPLALVPDSLDRYVVLDRPRAFCDGLDGTVAAIAGEFAERIRALTVASKRRSPPWSPVCAKFVGRTRVRCPHHGDTPREMADVRGFGHRHRFARFNGTSPIMAWSSNTVGVRVHRGGNRQVKTRTQRIAITRPCGGPGKDYLERPMANRNTKTEPSDSSHDASPTGCIARLFTDELARNCRLRSLHSR